MQKHDALRLVLTDTLDEDGVPMQQFLPQVPVAVEMRDFSQAENPETAALAWMQARFITPFDLQGKPLFRYGLIKVTAEHYYFSLQYHHLIVDGFAIALINQSLAAIYTDLLHNKAIYLDSPIPKLCEI
ncbi:hypothetical protein TPSD3_06690 [Thioflexithrix psekupsensis]|uniref:Condensation domain-containing protein n=1 Tax=Thioflexithrix psekupsensis TaxID=1570016 RepID=A0A251X8A6_9GAMM|nr:hypothetical protein TPSD3_06690 [Thioflexithrix psekupsensis]